MAPHPCVEKESGVHFLRQRLVFPRWIAFWLAWLAIGFAPVLAAEDVRAGAREDRSLPVLLIPFNKLANSTFESGATTVDLPLPQWLSISGATRGAPIVITTPVPHGLADDDRVVIKGVQGNPGANGSWTIQVTGPATFLLEGSVGTGLYAGGGAAFPARGQPVPPGAANERGELPWTPWFSVPAAIPATEFFRSDGARRTGEVSTFIALPPDNSFLSQEIDGSLFEPGERLCLSVEARVRNPVTSRQNLTIQATAAFSTARVYRTTYHFSTITGEYQRFSLCFALDAAPIPDGSVLRVQFINQMVGGEPQAMFWARPMLNEGLAPAPWTPSVEPMARTRAFY
ncbi:MAG: hypothetical protein ABI610_07610 [Acidobacteriota bacterium]